MSTLPIKYDVTEAALIELRKEQDEILNKEVLDIEEVKRGKRKVGKLRISIEKRRLEYNAEAQDYIKKVNALAKEAQAPVTQIENEYEIVIDKHDAEIARLEQEEKDKDIARVKAIEDRIEDIKFYSQFNGTSREIAIHMRNLESFWGNDFNYAEFKEVASSVYHQTFRDLEAMLCRVAGMESEQLRLEHQRKIDDENRAKFEVERAAFELEQKVARDKLQAERDALQKEIDIKEAAQRELERQERLKQEAIEHEKRQKELQEQAAIAAERQRQAEIAEQARLEQIKLEDDARKAAQEKEDKIRNAAPVMYEYLIYLHSEHRVIESEKEDLTKFLAGVSA